MEIQFWAKRFVLKPSGGALRLAGLDKTGRGGEVVAGLGLESSVQLAKRFNLKGGVLPLAPGWAKREVRI